jgi:hypothetical protein
MFPVDELVAYSVFGAAIACAVVFGAAWRRDRRRLTQLEDRLLGGSERAPGSDDLEERVNELANRVTQLARGQEFLQQFLSGQRRLPHSGRPVETSS